jgi:hypothetical protein
METWVYEKRGQWLREFPTLEEAQRRLAPFFEPETNWRWEAVYDNGLSKNALYNRSFDTGMRLYHRDVPLWECEWAWLNPCGCPIGCAHPVTADEDEAWLDMFGAEATQWNRAQGVTAQLMTFDRARVEVFPKMRLDYKCPHKEEGK